MWLFKELVIWLFKKRELIIGQTEISWRVMSVILTVFAIVGTSVTIISYCEKNDPPPVIPVEIKNSASDEEKPVEYTVYEPQDKSSKEAVNDLEKKLRARQEGIKDKKETAP